MSWSRNCAGGVVCRLLEIRQQEQLLIRSFQEAFLATNDLVKMGLGSYWSMRDRGLGGTSNGCSSGGQPSPRGDGK